MKVLIVGNDPVVVSALTGALSTWKPVRYHVERVGNLVDALEKIAAQLPDVVLLDCESPTDDSLEILRKLRVARPEVPVIVVSGSSDDELAVQAIQAGAADFLPVGGLPALLARAVYLAIEKIRAIQDLDRLNSNLVGIVSHDVKAPMGNIIGYTDLLLADDPDQPLSARQRHMVERIRDNGLFTLRLVHDLLDMVRIDSRRLQLTPGRHDLNTLINECIDRCSFLADGNQVKMKKNCKPGAIQAVLDYPKMLQVLNNLVSNALKFSAPGSTVIISARQRGLHVEISVADTGQGIPKDELKRLFRKFSKTSARPKRGEKGSGLGLYIASEFVKLHNGSIRVRSTPGKGSTFTIRLLRDGVVAI